MDDSTIHGIIVSVYLAALVVSLVVYLVRQKIPRGAVLDVVGISVVVFAVLSEVSYGVADRIVLNGGDSFLVYVPPVIPVAILAIWLSRRVKNR